MLRRRPTFCFRRTDEMIITVASGKGGVGKSTVSSGLGAALARKGKRVLLIDCDCGLRSLDLMVGVSGSCLFDLGDVTAGRCSFDDALVPAEKAEGLWLMPAPSDVGAIDEPGALASVADTAAEKFDFVILDCAAGIAADFRSAVKCADAVIAVVTPDPICVRDASRVSAVIRSLTDSPVRMLVNRVDEAMIKTGRMPNVDEAIDGAGIRLLGVIPEDARVPLSAAAGIPLRKGRAAAAFDRVADRVMGKKVPLPRDGKL